MLVGYVVTDISERRRIKVSKETWTAADQGGCSIHSMFTSDMKYKDMSATAHKSSAVLVDLHLPISETGQIEEGWCQVSTLQHFRTITCTRNCKRHAKLEIHSQFFFSKFRPEWKQGCADFALCLKSPRAEQILSRIWEVCCEVLWWDAMGEGRMSWQI